MKILFLSHYFPPEVNAPASRTYEHCRQWVLDGHEVTVVTCAPNHPRGQVYPGYRNRMFQREEMDGIHVIRLWTLLSPNEGTFRRTLNYVSYLISVVIALPWLPKTSVVVSTSPQFFNGLAGYFVSRLGRMRWVLEIRDLWPDSILAVGAIKNRFVIGVLERLELFAYRRADWIVPVTDAFRRHMISKGIDGSKITVIKNGVDLSFFTPRTGDPEFARKHGLNDKFVVAYVGTHGMAHHLETILEAAALIEEPDIAFVLVGDGAERDRLLKLRESMELRNVLMLPQLPKADMPMFWGITDVSLVHLKRAELFTTVIPSKIFESMGMMRPIVLGVEGEARVIVEEAQAGICIEPENPSQLAAAVKKLYMDRTLCDRFGHNGRQYVQTYFDRVALARRFEQILFSL